MPAQARIPAPRLAERHPDQYHLDVGVTVHLVGGLIGVAIGIALLTTAASEVFGLLPGLTVAGVATGMLNTGLAREGVATVPSQYAATGTAANNTVRYLGVSAASLIAASDNASGLVAAWGHMLWAGLGAS